MKTSKIISCVFTNQSVTAHGTFYYHKISFENGDTGSIGCKEQMPTKIAVGAVLSYEMDSSGKIKQVPITPAAVNSSGNGVTNPNVVTGAKKNYAKQPADFLGYAYGYSKDLVVARIAKGEEFKDVADEVVCVARAIYKAMKEDLLT